MDSHSNNNDDGGRPSNSLQIYRTNHERGQLATGVGSPHEVRREFGACHQPAGSAGMPIVAPMPSHIQSSYAVGAPPLGTKILVDPTTGQQYFVPTAQPQVAYYPVYYPQSQPIFYQAAPTGYFLPSHQHPQVPSSPTHHAVGAQPMFFPSTSSTTSQPPPSNYVSTTNASYVQSQAYGSSPYHVEIPPSNASVASSHFQRNHESRVSMESGASSASGSSRNKHSDDSVSPALHHVSRPTAEASDSRTPTLARGVMKLFPDNWLHNSTRYSSAASSSSGFYSVLSNEPTLEKSHLSTRLSGASDSQGSPTHGPAAGGDMQPKSVVRPQPQPQQWWHDGDSPRMTVNMESSHREEKSPLHGSPCHVDAAALDRRHSASPAPPAQPTDQLSTAGILPPPRPTQKSIRMDFDLSDLSINVDQPTTPVVVEKTKLSVTPATAFTISFDDNDPAGDNTTRLNATTTSGQAEGRSPKKTPLSLQDAARQAPTGRRLLRRSAAPSKPSADATRQDPKEYLFSKMFEHGNGAARNEASHHQNLGGSMGISQFGAPREMDTASEAGTYIVEKEGNMMTSQVLSTDEDESSSVVSSSTSSSTTTISNNGGLGDNQQSPQLLPRPTAVRPENPAASALFLRPRPSAAAGAVTASVQPKSPPSARRSLMSDLRRLRDEKSDQPPTSPRRVPPVTAVKSLAQKSTVSSTGFLPSIAASGDGPPTRLCQGRFAVGGEVGLNTNAFRPSARCHSETRADGGRFSMRTTGAAPSCAAGVYRPGANASAVRPRNAVLRPTATANRPAHDTPEMVAWLRRKEYDPRKAAAEARKMQQLKQSLIKLASGCEKVLETELGQQQQLTAKGPLAVPPSKKWPEETYLANRSMSYHNAGGFLSSANSAFQQWHKPLNCNKSYDNLSCLGEESGAGSGLDDFAQLAIAQTSSNLKRTVDALTEKCNKSIELIKLCNKNALSPSVENLLQSVVESSGQPSIDQPADGGEDEENGAKISDRLERLNSAFDAIQKYLEEQSSSTIATSAKLLDLMPSSSVAYSSSSSVAGVDSRPAGSSTQRFLLGISELANARNVAVSFSDGSPTDDKDENNG